MEHIFPSISLHLNRDSNLPSDLEFLISSVIDSTGESGDPKYTLAFAAASSGTYCSVSFFHRWFYLYDARDPLVLRVSKPLINGY